MGKYNSLSEEEQKATPYAEMYNEDGSKVYNYALAYTEYIAITAAKIKSLEKQYNTQIDQLQKENNELKAQLEIIKQHLGL